MENFKESFGNFEKFLISISIDSRNLAGIIRKTFTKFWIIFEDDLCDCRIKIVEILKKKTLLRF